MKLRLAILGASLMSLMVNPAQDGMKAGPTWLSDLGEAAALAKQTGQPMLAVFR